MTNIQYPVQYLAKGSSIKGDDIKVITIINGKHTVLLRQKKEIANIFFKQLAAEVVLLDGLIPASQKSSVLIRLRANLLFGKRPNPRFMLVC